VTAPRRVSLVKTMSQSILREAGHRPWPLPRRPWRMRQSWHDLLFAHWPVEPALLRPLVPGPFEIDTFDGSAWVGVVPFWMSGVALRGLPALPSFPELNVRTYVTAGERAGVYFFSLDAASRLAVWGARSFLNLPYFHATMAVSSSAAVQYTSRRHGGAAAAEFRASYQPDGTPFHPADGTLEWFLTERYCLYHLDRGGAPARLEIHHPRWLLQRAQASIDVNTMGRANGIDLPARPPLLHFAKRQDMVAWLPERLRPAAERISLWSPVR
jgi:uncharacterized protein YqjF (DUF2071 family)